MQLTMLTVHNPEFCQEFDECARERIPVSDPNKVAKQPVHFPGLSSKLPDHLVSKPDSLGKNGYQ